MIRAIALPIRPFVAYDLTRLFLAPAHVTPRGIDRVDLGYARHFLADWPGDAAATLLSPFGLRVLERREALRVVDFAEAHWKEGCHPCDDRLLNRVKRKLADRSDGSHVIKIGSRGRQIAGMMRQVLRHAGRIAGASRSHAIARNGIYLNTGQMGIAVPQLLSWLAARPDIRSVFMLHDLIPIEYAQFVPALSSYFHNNMVTNAMAHASGLITTTKTMGHAIQQEFMRRGHPGMPVLSEPLPVSPSFLNGRSADERLSQAPYFVIVGSIELRKNHALLLEVWRELLRTEGARTPVLVMAGTRWNGHEAVTGAVNASPELRDVIIEVGGMSTPALHQLISNARGLLMPSFAEGFGLPIIEAQALGVPVIASDNAVHRETGGGGVRYINPCDVAGWADAIRAIMASPLSAAPCGAIRTWPDYFRRIEPFLSAIAAQNSTSGDILNSNSAEVSAA